MNRDADSQGRQFLSGVQQGDDGRGGPSVVARTTVPPPPVTMSRAVYTPGRLAPLVCTSTWNTWIASQIAPSVGACIARTGRSRS